MNFPFGESEFLTLRLGAAASQPERLMLIGRPQAGRVRVRQWTSDSWNTEGEDFETSAAELLADIERLAHARGQVSEEIFRVQSWLTGMG